MAVVVVVVSLVHFFFVYSNSKSPPLSSCKIYAQKRRNLHFNKMYLLNFFLSIFNTRFVADDLGMCVPLKTINFINNYERKKKRGKKCNSFSSVCQFNAKILQMLHLLLFLLLLHQLLRLLVKRFFTYLQLSRTGHFYFVT